MDALMLNPLIQIIIVYLPNTFDTSIIIPLIYTSIDFHLLHQYTYSLTVHFLWKLKRSHESWLLFDGEIVKVTFLNQTALMKNCSVVCGKEVCFLVSVTCVFLWRRSCRNFFTSNSAWARSYTGNCIYY